MDLFERKIQPVMEKILDKWDVPGMVIRIDKLELDLGRFKPEELETKWEKVLEEVLEEELLKQMGVVAGPDEVAGQLTPESAAQEVLLHYLRTGSLPWNAADTGGFSLENSLATVLDTVKSGSAASQVVLTRLSEVLKSPAHRVRLVTQTAASTRGKLLEVLLPERAKLILTLESELKLALQSLPEPPVPRTQIATRLAVIALGFAAEPQAPPSRLMAEHEILIEFLRQLLPEQVLPLASFLRTLLKSTWAQQNLTAKIHALSKEIPALSSQEPEKPASETAEKRQTGEQNDAIAEIPAAENEKSVIHPTGEVENSPGTEIMSVSGEKTPEIPASKDEVDWEEETPASDSPVMNKAQEEETEIQSASSEEKASENLSKTEKKEKQTAEKASEQLSKPESEMEIRLKEWRKKLEENPQEIWEKSVRKSDPIPWFSEEEREGIFVQNAGLVLLANFFKPFFNQIGLLEGREFKDGKAQLRAVYLYHYLATGEAENVEESALVFPKVLAGLDWTDPLPESYPPSKKEQTEATTLLETVASYWTALGKTKPETLQRNFISRPGKLSHDHNGWLLQVEKGVLDILLDRLPWGYGTIRIPWLDEIIHVEW